VNQLLQNVMKASPLRLAIGLAIAAVAAALLFGLISFSGREQKELLFADLDLTEAGRIGERLDQAKVPYEVRGDGSSIFVPRSRVAEVRLMLAADGLLSRGSVGYELFDQSDPLGQTQFQQDINRLRALEGELARTIVALDAVSSARVHLVLPERRLFEQDKEQPSASILLKLIGGTISAEQVQAIRNLAAGAVPGLLPGKVTILDDRGELLAAEDPEGTAGAAAVADERKQAYETRIRAIVLDIVEGVVGQGGARVQVTADMDFNRIAQTEERFDPEGRVVRSTQTNEEKTQGEQIGGAATAGNNLPDGSSFEDDAGGGESSERSSETVNYEISRTTRTETIEGGRLTRLSVAVAVDGVLTPGADGQPAQWAPRDPAEIERIAALVRSAVGFSEQRGDVVEVVSVRLARAEVQGSEAVDPKGFDLSKIDPLRIAELVAALVAGLALIFFVLRPLVKGPGKAAPQAAPALPAAQGGAAVILPKGEEDEDGSTIDVAQITGAVKASSVRRVAEVVQAHPERTVAVLRDWLGNSAGG